jgi:predicted Fe-Mo cluster-binding NifX family protein
MEKIAIAVRENGKKVEHFGKCEYFIIYKYDEKTHDIEYNNVIYSSKSHDTDSEEWEKSADSIDGVNIVICEKIGLKAKAEVERRGIKVIESEGFIEDILDDSYD